MYAWASGNGSRFYGSIRHYVVKGHTLTHSWDTCSSILEGGQQPQSSVAIRELGHMLFRKASAVSVQLGV